MNHNQYETGYLTLAVGGAIACILFWINEYTFLAHISFWICVLGIVTYQREKSNRINKND